MPWSRHRSVTMALVGAGTSLAVTLAWFAPALSPEDDPPIAAVVHEPVPNPRPGETVSAAELERGRVYYAQLCMSCHGVRGDGQGEWAYRVVPRPADLRSARTQARSDTRLLEIISDGVAGTAMTAWRRHLSEAQRWQVVAYLRHLGNAPGARHD